MLIRLDRPERVGEVLRDLRAMFGLSQRQMAELMGSHQGRYSEHENGKVIPDLVTAIRLFGNLDFDLALVPKKNVTDGYECQDSRGNTPQNPA